MVQRTPGLVQKWCGPHTGLCHHLLLVVVPETEKSAKKNLHARKETHTHTHTHYSLFLSKTLPPTQPPITIYTLGEVGGLPLLLIRDRAIIFVVGDQ